ncbi:MAG: FAD-dependent oxidoreductase [Jatrophihabitantaceae bacterium]
MQDSPGVAPGQSLPRTKIAIVGGGIAGLYCTYRLAQSDRFDIVLLEAASRFGGRIETVDMHGFTAEFGPMRFEPEIEHHLERLINELDLTFGEFSAMGDDQAATATATERYNFRRDELQDESRSGRALGPQPLGLLRLGVLRMFREPLQAYLADAGVDIEVDLNADTAAKPPQGRWAAGVYSAGRRDWIPKKPWQGDDKIFRCRCLIQEWLDHFNDGNGVDSYTELRKTAKHRNAPLWNEAFWNAMSRELSHAAMRYIRDEGTFYHLFPDNPNAVEWGIFWLRLFRTEADDLREIQGGSESLVKKLTEKLETLSYVRLRAGQEVLRLRPAADSSAVCLSVRDHRTGERYDAEADHCILALPLAPLNALSSNFPEEVRAGLSYAFGFPLLKCFLQVKNPWWRKDTPPHAGAYAVTTRELHYWRKRKQPGGQVQADNTPRGLVMAYTDHPASQFWKEYVISLPIHDRAEVSSAEGALKDALVYQLLVVARRQAHLELKELLLDAAAAGRPDGSSTDDECEQVEEFVKKIKEELTTSQALRDQVAGWYSVVIGGELPKPVTYRHLERLLDVVRNPNWYEGWHYGVRAEAQQTLLALFGAPPNEWEPLVKAATDRTSEHERLGAIVEERGQDVELWGIRDWSRWPVGAGCHAWYAGARSWEIMQRLQAFGLTGRPSHRHHRNVHICGEAVSDYQGFIEGALRSAERVIGVLAADTC